MELREYIKILLKRIWLFFSVVVVFIVATYAFTITRPDMFAGSITLYTLATPEIEKLDDSDFYQYNNYYSFKASESYLDTVYAWLKDPAVIARIYEKANEELPSENLNKYSKLLKPQKSIPASLMVSIKSDDEEYVKNLLNATGEIVDQKTQEWNSQGILENASIEAGEPFVVREKPDMALNLGISIIISAILGLAAVYFTEYMQKK